jgi:hypothetical protein
MRHVAEIEFRRDTTREDVNRLADLLEEEFDDPRTKFNKGVIQLWTDD